MCFDRKQKMKEVLTREDLKGENTDEKKKDWEGSPMEVSQPGAQRGDIVCAPRTGAI